MKRAAIYILTSMLLVMSGCGSSFKMPKANITGESAWLFARMDLSGSGSKESAYSGKLDIIWESKSNDKPAGPLTLADGFLIYPGAKRKIKFFSLADGEYAGRLKVKGNPQSGFVAAGRLGFVAVGYPWSRLNCFDLESGDRIWRQPLRDALSGTIIVNDHLIVGSTDGWLFAIDTADGQIIWNRQISGRLTASPVFDGTNIIQPADDGRLFAISPDDGSEKYAATLEAPLISSAVIGRQIFLADFFGNIHCLDKADGHVVWSAAVAGPVWSPPALSDERLFVTHGDGELAALDARSGQTLWNFSAQEVMVASPTVIGDVVVVGTKRGRVFSVRVADGSLIESRTLNGALSFAPVSDGKRVYLATDKGLIICFGDQNATYDGNSKELSAEHGPE